MGNCVLHFGMHKTGSSSIQHSLSGASDLGPDHCFINFGTRTGNLSRELVTTFADEPGLAEVNRKRGIATEELLKQRPGVRARLREEVAAAGERTAIISAEVVSKFTEREFARLARALERAAGSVSAVGYVRPPAERMASSFQQRLKGGHDRFDPAEFYPGYRLVEAFDKVVGRERVSLWKFDPARFPDGDVVRDFCGRFGIAIAADEVVRVNEGLSRPAMSILFAYRLYGPGHGVGSRAVRENWALIEALQEVSGPKFVFDESVVTPVLEDNREDLAWIEERLGEELRSKSFGTEGVGSQDELLEIEASALSALIDAVQRHFAVELPRSVINRVDTDPRAVAETVQACRDAIRARLFGPSEHQEKGTSPHRGRCNLHRRLIARPAWSAGRWRQSDGGAIMLAPTTGRPAVVGLEAPAMSDTGEVVFTARVRSSDAPLLLRLSIAAGGEEGRVLDEIRVAGRADRLWTVPVPVGSGDRALRLSCVRSAGGSKGRRARVRVTGPTLGPAAR